MNLRQLPNFNSNVCDGASVCEACGQSFTCGAASNSCWCAEISLSEETRSALSTRYRRCLCRACLETLARTTEGRATNTEAQAHEETI